MQSKSLPLPTRRPSRAQPMPTLPDHRTILARRLEVLSGAELQHGHHAAAERLAWRAAALREAVR